MGTYASKPLRIHNSCTQCLTVKCYRLLHCVTVKQCRICTSEVAGVGLFLSVEGTHTGDIETSVHIEDFTGDATGPVRAEECSGVTHFLNGNVEEVDRKSTRLNSSHVKISYAVFCLKKKRRHLRSLQLFSVSGV